MGEPHDETWSEADSGLFADLGEVFVPERALQIETLCALVPPPAGPCHMVELCCGAGALAQALLARFPEARVHAYDGSPHMLAQTGKAAGAHAGRLETRQFDLAARDWRRFPWPVHAVLSSLAVHHLDGTGKRALYADMARALAPGGVLLIADLVAPQGALAEGLAAATWEREVRRSALERDGHLGAYERFQETGWNFFSDPDPDLGDQPSPLLDQLLWLREAGLEQVDVFWMKAGHAIFGGSKQLS